MTLLEIIKISMSIASQPSAAHMMAQFIEDFIQEKFSEANTLNSDPKIRLEIQKLFESITGRTLV